MDLRTEETLDHTDVNSAPSRKLPISYYSVLFATLILFTNLAKGLCKYRFNKRRHSKAEFSSKRENSFFRYINQVYEKRNSEYCCSDSLPLQYFTKSQTIYLLNKFCLLFLLKTYLINNDEKTINWKKFTVFSKQQYHGDYDSISGCHDEIYKTAGFHIRLGLHFQRPHAEAIRL
jgi:hypothetical protein